jgi:hypothetical protein
MTHDLQQQSRRNSLPLVVRVGVTQTIGIAKNSFYLLDARTTPALFTRGRVEKVSIQMPVGIRSASIFSTQSTALAA